MPFVIENVVDEGQHRWVVARCSCDLQEDNDPLLTTAARLVRDAYGEAEILAATETDPLMGVDPAVSAEFDLDAIRAGFRLGLPDPAEEHKKKPWLRNYRSEACELLARELLRTAHEVTIPLHPQRGKANANQPFLGFDGWGLLTPAGEGHHLVLKQVKATDDPSVPPSEATKLAHECAAIPTDLGKLSRAISVLAVNLRGTPEGHALLRMLGQIGRGSLPSMVVAPVVVRGTTKASVDDLEPVRSAVSSFAPALARGAVVSISVELTAFGERVMMLARAA